MNLVDRLHGGLVHPRRVRVLAAHAARLIAPGAHVLDIGSGDGRLAAAVARSRPDLRVEGLDVLVRHGSPIPIEQFDGRVIPRPADSVDVVTFFDVLHHTDDPAALLREAARVARSSIVLKDHLSDGTAARWLLRVMDVVGNRRYGVALPHNYWSARQWTAALEELGLAPEVWDVGGLGLYPWPASLLFGRRLHVLARLHVSKHQR